MVTDVDNPMLCSFLVEFAGTSRPIPRHVTKLIKSDKNATLPLIHLLYNCFSFFFADLYMCHYFKPGHNFYAFKNI